MEIQIDEAAIRDSITGSATKAVTTALDGWETQQAIGRIVSATVAEGAIGKAIQEAIARVDHGALVAMLAAEVQRATTRAVVSIIEEGVVDILCKLRNVGTYSTEDKRAREAIRAEVRGRG